ncbi:hypothetical protein OHA37_25075 [Streptomyces sp. NBC_00335]|uniref:hypothetical protein n=1 Tax=unclassified Streptomyces TaxID=2593676 RepID=UPI00224EF8F3|nr:MULTISPECIES: hypothetical protein [unclassified Streptomyces]MCX5407128.1 hypothetical protein [Streptomyces sp. NBC_00086]
MNRRPLVIAAATVGVLATAAIALPNLPPNPLTDRINDRVFKEKGMRFATAADAPTSGEPTRGEAALRKRARGEETWVLPQWVPKDATDVRIMARTDGEARLLHFTLGATPLDGPQCSAGTPSKHAGTALEAKWWPAGTGSEERPECRGTFQYQVTVRGKEVYAWTDGTRSPGAGTQGGVPVRQVSATAP